MPTPTALALVVASPFFPRDTGVRGVVGDDGIFVKDAFLGWHPPEVVALAVRPGAHWPVVPVKEWCGWKEERHRHTTTATMSHLSNSTFRALKAGKLRTAIAYSYGSLDPHELEWSALPLSR